LLTPNYRHCLLSIDCPSGGGGGGGNHGITVTVSVQYFLLKISGAIIRLMSALCNADIMLALRPKFAPAAFPWIQTQLT